MATKAQQKRDAKVAAEAARAAHRAREERIDTLRRARADGASLPAEDVALLAADDARLLARYGAPRPAVRLTEAEQEALYEDMGGVLDTSGHLPH